MKEAIVSAGPKVKIVDSPIPKPKAGQVLIKVVFSGSNPKDWKYPEMGDELNSGDDIAGYIEELGEGVIEFKKGDRVAAFHEMMTPNGSFAEYAIAWEYTTFHLPEKTSFEEAATIPLAGLTAAVGMFEQTRLGLPEPWKAELTAKKPTPLIVYGAAGAVGAFAIKYAQASNIHPIIAVGSNKSFIEKLISPEKGDAIVNYRDGDEATVAGIKEALKKAGHSEVHYAFDAVSEHNSYQNISKVLAKGGKITLVLPGKDYTGIGRHVDQSITMVGAVHGMRIEPGSLADWGQRQFGYVFTRLFTRGLEQGWFTGHPYEVVPGGLKGVETGLANLKAGKASAVKYIFHIADTK